MTTEWKPTMQLRQVSQLPFIPKLQQLWAEWSTVYEMAESIGIHREWIIQSNEPIETGKTEWRDVPVVESEDGK